MTRRLSVAAVLVCCLSAGACASTGPTGAATGTAVPSACTRGCDLPADHDAVTVMASGATAVVIARAEDVREVDNATETEFIPDKVLQGNENHLVYPVDLSGFFAHLDDAFALTDRKTYLVFMSFNRGGPCVASLYSYDSRARTASFIDQNYDGDVSAIRLDGRVLPIPKTMSLAYVEARMSPRGGAVYPSDTDESYCPGP
ncbi:MAG: hypothetical protein ACRDY1_11535 [Acidimicrobiales bacterium]